MSKAFTSEETPEPTSPTREPPRLAPGEVRYVTPEGHAALRAELERLRAPGAPGDAEARARRIHTLDRTLSTLTVLGPERLPEGEVGFGSWVTVEDEDGARRTYRLVGPDEVDPRGGAVSAHGPLGAALLGRRAGEAVEVELPGGARELTVVDVRRRPPGG
jgi:transcription elongation factor GreB